MRILLTGSSGFIGRHVLAALLARGHQVVCAGRTPPADRPGVTFVAADFAVDTDAAHWLPRLAGVDAVVNTVGIFRQAGAQTFARLHVETPCALFAACVQADVKVVVQLSALGSDAHADTGYHLSKKKADDVLAQLPLQGAIVQPSLVYGRDGASARVFRMLASLPLFLRFGGSPQLVQPVHIDDLIAAIVRLLDAPPAPMARIALVGPQALPFTDYVAALRRALGMGRLRVLRLPHWCARAAAALGRFVPGSLLDADALRMLDRGNSADPAAITRLLGHAPRAVAGFVDDPGPERVQAKLGWLLPLLRLAIAAVWFATAIVSAGPYPVEQSYELLERTGVPPQLAPLMLYGACGVDLLMGLGCLFLKRRRWLWAAQFALIGFYTVVIAFRLPEFMLHPYGPLTKNLPMLAAIWLLFELDEKQ